ncbi:MAG: bifunctional phosphoglucose/phosphomannose isomerase [Salibacteraceae bacterium]
MRELVDSLPNQIEEAIQIANNAVLKANSVQILNVCISGLGGSGIGGTIVSQLTANEAKIPVVVNKDYSIPAFIGENTLFIASSYSGNTEETLAALKLAETKGAVIACVTSGGELLSRAKEKNYTLIEIPGGYPPRAAFGYSSIQLFKLFTHFGIISSKFMDDLTKVPAHLISNKEDVLGKAKDLTDKFLNIIPIIYSDAMFEGIGVRFRQQLNENSKMLAWHHVLPEMNHNELVGWAPKYESTSVVILRNDHDNYRTQKRMDITKDISCKSTSSVTEIWSNGSNVLEKAYYLVYFGDWVSVLLAEKQGIDAVEVDVITGLKNALAKI